MMTARPLVLRPLGLAARALPLFALVGCLYLLGDRLAGFRFDEIGTALGKLGWWQWAGALLLTGVSFAAIGQYDAVIHRVIGSGVAPGRARAAGVRAIALSQTVGFASLSGGLVRLRCLPELDLWTISRLSLLVSMSFLGSWAVLAGGTVLLRHTGPAGLILLLLLLIGGCVLRFRPAPHLPGLSPKVGPALLVWTLIDTASAALVLGLLLPPGMMPDPLTLYAAYLLALGAGLLSQSPAGLGAFELTLLLVLPQVPDAALLAAVLAYRVIYFLIPAGLALICLIRPARVPAPAALHPVTGAARLRALARAPCADWGLAHQGAEVVLSRDHAAGWLLRRAGGCLVALGRPLGPPDLPGLAALARDRGLTPALYKCDARTAAQAQGAGWSVLRISSEAVIETDRWSLALPACRHLRRKLKAAQAGGLRIDRATATLPLDAMAQVAQSWAVRNHGEKGFSMGRFAPDLLGHQQVFLALVGPRLIGFASFHGSRHDWSLDLMRQDDAAPPGTMHALLAAGIAAAAQAGCRRVSLAAVTDLPGRLAGPGQRLPGVAGLRQFKRSFGPAWRPLYLCTPSRLGLVRAVFAITVAVHRTMIDWPRVTWRKWSGGSAPHFEIETPDQPCDMPRA